MTNSNLSPQAALPGQPPEFFYQLGRIEGLLKVLNASASLCQTKILASVDDADRLNRYCAYLQEDCDRLKEAAIALQVLIVGEDAQ
jgi:hypothetical protein